jgi:hypothetical protein
VARYDLLTDLEKLAPCHRLPFFGYLLHIVLHRTATIRTCRSHGFLPSTTVREASDPASVVEQSRIEELADRAAIYDALKQRLQM